MKSFLSIEKNTVKKQSQPFYSIMILSSFPRDTYITDYAISSIPDVSPHNFLFYVITLES